MIRSIAAAAVLVAAAILPAPVLAQKGLEATHSNEPFINATGPIVTGQYQIPLSPRYDYSQALHMSYLFYHSQISGKLKHRRLAWRDDSCFLCKGDYGEDLSGAWFEAANTMKWGLPLGWTAQQLNWNVWQFKETFAAMNQLEESLFWVRQGAEYFINSYTTDGSLERLVGVFGLSEVSGQGDIDFGYFGPAEEYEMWVPKGIQRKAAYCTGSKNNATAAKGCTDIAGDYSAALSSASILFRDSDPAFATKCLDMAKTLYNFANNYRGSYASYDDQGFKNMKKWYPSKRFTDELALASIWLHIASQPNPTPKNILGTTSEYLPIAIANYAVLNDFGEASWDETGAEVAALLYIVTGTYKYMQDLRDNLFDAYLDVTPAVASLKKVPRTPRGLAYYELWGSLSYSANVAMIGFSVAEAIDRQIPTIPAANQTAATRAGISKDYAREIRRFGIQQINYILGDCGRSWVVGFGNKFPRLPYHKSSYNSLIDYPLRNRTQDVVGDDFLKSRTPNRFILYGAIGGGPNTDDSYYDDREAYQYTEVTQDYNAGWTGALAGVIGYYMSADAGSISFKPFSDCTLDLGWNHPNASEATRRQKWASTDCYHTCAPCTGLSGNGSSSGNGTNGNGGRGNGQRANHSVNRLLSSIAVVLVCLGIAFF
ncbi:family 9 glycoside hydrolase [Cladochytrium replicatum]|nr:family 9 glycoside hydrolase [Cladochytrium replicatum]